MLAPRSVSTRTTNRHSSHSVRSTPKILTNFNSTTKSCILCTKCEGSSRLINYAASTRASTRPWFLDHRPWNLEHLELEPSPRRYLQREHGEREVAERSRKCNNARQVEVKVGVSSLKRGARLGNARKIQCAYE